MAYLLICVRRQDTLVDRAVFSRDLAPVQFDSSEIGLASRHDPCTNSAQYFIIHNPSQQSALSNNKHVQSGILKQPRSLSLKKPVTKGILKNNQFSSGSNRKGGLHTGHRHSDREHSRTSHEVEANPRTNHKDETIQGASHKDCANSGTSHNDETNPGTSHNDGTHPGSSHKDGTNPGTSYKDETNPGTSHNDKTNTGTSHKDGTYPGTSYKDETNPGTSHNDGTNTGTSHKDATNPGTGHKDGPHSRTNQDCTCSYDGSGGCEHCDTVHPAFSLVLLDIQHKIVANLRSDVAYCSFHELVRSKVFRKGFVNFMSKKYKFKDMRQQTCVCENVYLACESGISLPRLLEVCVEPAAVDICYSWNARLGSLVRKRISLEGTMAWLSTLGGGYSSLGDYIEHFSEQAGKLSITQLKIAMEMGDPILAAKCRLFYALSLMQRGPLQQSKKLIRREFYFATHFKIRDQKLIDMCKGMWSKLQYLHSVRWRQKLVATSSQQLLTTASSQELTTTSC